MLLVTVINLAVTFNVGKLIPFIILLIIFVLGEKIVKKELANFNVFYWCNWANIS